MRKIGIFGGSFNPIHTGHIALAQAVQKQCGLDEVWLMVSPQNPLKRNDSDLLDDSLRFELQNLSKDYPDYTFILLIGGDNWAHFQRWRHWQEIMEHHEVIVYPRDSYPGTIDVPLLDVSSTEIRQRVRAGESIEGLVPEAIVPLVKKYY